MKILAIDSTAKICTAALCDGERLCALEVENAGMTHSETLLPMIEHILKKQNTKPSDIELFVLSAGPGSFTGVRIGAATVKGLCFGRDVPCVGVSSLEALAYNRMDSEGIVACAMDARRDQVYFALFRVLDGKVERLLADMAISLDEMCDKCTPYSNEPIYLCGDGAQLAYERLKQKTAIEPILDVERAGQNAYSVALCGYRAYMSGERVSDVELRPTYLRLAQAERERLEKLNNKG